jgi:hypothetical protein
MPQAVGHRGLNGIVDLGVLLKGTLRSVRSPRPASSSSPAAAEPPLPSEVRDKVCSAHGPAARRTALREEALTIAGRPIIVLAIP